MSDEAKAISDVAKTAKTFIKATQQLGGFMAKFVAGPSQEVSLYIQERIRFARFERQVRFLEKATEMLNDSGIKELRAIPLKTIVPLIEAAALEEDDELQDRWANLLINAADQEHIENVTRSHISILSQLSALEVRILEVVYSLPYERIQHEGATTNNLPYSADIKDERIEYSLPDEPIQIAIGNLVRLNCLKIGTTWGGGETFDRVLPTKFGQNFVKACTRKKE